MKNVFYQVDQACTYKTLDAWQMIVSGAKHWRLNMFESTYGLYDWTVEPSQSFDSLVQLRIRNLREKYKKIRLWYSAGRDSHFILKAFVDQGVAIDELVFVDWQYVESVKHDLDVVKTVLSNLYQGRDMPKFVVFRPTHTDYLRYWKNIGNQLNSGGIGSNHGFNVNSFSSIMDCFEEFSDADTCNLMGLEKPKLYVDCNGVNFQMVDASVQHGMSPLHNIEWFFLNDSVPELVIKQCHMLLRYAKIFAAEHFDNNLSAALTELQWDQQYYNEFCMALGLGPAASLVTGSGTRKNYGLGKHKYLNLHATADSDHWDATRHYTKFYHQASDLIDAYKHPESTYQLTGNYQLTGIKSKSYRISNVI